MLRSPSWLIMSPRMRPQTPVAMTKDLIVQHGLTEEEYQKIVTLLGRELNLTELGMFSVMWSEHCSYKSSRTFLKKLPMDAPHVIQGPGENAGVVDIGRRSGCRLQDGKPQPSVLHRAVPRRRDGGRGHPPRHLHDGCTPD